MPGPAPGDWFVSAMSRAANFNEPRLVLLLHQDATLSNVAAGAAINRDVSGNVVAGSMAGWRHSRLQGALPPLDQFS
jgi:hypothetical protein